MRQTKAAEQLIKYVQAEFGEHLAALMLGDYGSRRRRQWQTFLVTLSDRDQKLELNIEIKTEHRWGLACGQEPLVIIALLKLMLSRDELHTGRSSYTYQELLMLLGWRDSKRSRDRICDAIDINFIQSFNLSSDGDEIQTPMFYLRRQHMMTGYEFIDKVKGSEQWGEIGSYRGDFLIDFNLDFIRALRERSLLGINWNLVTDVTRLPLADGISEELI